MLSLLLFVSAATSSDGSSATKGAGCFGTYDGYPCEEIGADCASCPQCSAPGWECQDGSCPRGAVSRLRPPPPTGKLPAPSPPSPGPMPAGCYVDDANGPVSFKYAPGNVFPTDATHPHGLRLVDSPAQCCTLCQAHKNCTFWTYSAGGSAAKPTCYSYSGACCFLKTAAAWAGRVTASGNIESGSTAPLPSSDISCRNGTNCGGTNLWTKWEDTSLPNSSYTNPGSMPYPRSLDLIDWEFKSGANPGYGSAPGVSMYKGASADTFYPTWAADNNLYTGFTDGNVCDYETRECVHANSEGSAPAYTISHGQATIVGDDPFALNITKVRAYTERGYSAYPYGGRFPSGSLVYKGTWWYGTYFVPNYPKGPLVGGLLGPTVDYRHSTDFGETWVEPRLNATSLSDNLFGEVGDPMANPTGPARVKFGTPHWVDFGQELEHSPDGKAYVVAHGATSPTSTEMWMLGDQVYMARVTPTVADIDDKSKWEFYAGGHGADAKWVAGDVSKATPLLEWTNHTGSTTMTYFAGIKKYIISICTASHYPVMDGGHFDTYFLESDSITGPWKYVTYMKSFGPQVYFANFVSKFTAKQANMTSKTFESFLMYSANYDPGGARTPQPLPNAAYHMNLQQTRFTLSDAFAAKLGEITAGPGLPDDDDGGMCCQKNGPNSCLDADCSNYSDACC